MAEVIGAISASLHLTQKLVKYCQSFKSAPADAANLAEEVTAIAQVLQGLRKTVQNPPPAISFQQTSSLLLSVQNCERRLKSLEISLAPHVSRLGKLFKRAKWPLEHGQTAEAIEALHRFVQIFHLATTLDGLAALSLPVGETLEKLDQLQRAHEAGLQDIIHTLGLLPGVELQLSGLNQRFDRFVVDVASESQNERTRRGEESAYRELCEMLAKIPTSEFQDRHRTLQLTRMNGGSRWIFDAPNYVAWQDGRSFNNTLWCNGGPGVGKTYLASVIIDELLSRARQQGDKCRVLIFYFDYSKQVDQTPLRVLQTLLHQLLSTNSSVPSLASELAEDLRLGKPLPSFDDMKDLFVSLCNVFGQPVFIVLDALDECDAAANRKPILELIKSIKTSKAKLLVTSRPYPPDVDEVLGDCPQVLVEASDKDIRKYVLEQIADNVEMRRMLKNRDDLKQEIVNSVLDKSQGMFLLPALQINNILGQTNVDEVRQALEMLPSGLADNLAMTIERIKKQHSQNKRRSTLAFLVLQWLSTVERPITTRELQHAIAARPGHESLGSLTDANLFVESCFGLTIVDEETSVVRLVHFSVKEFLQEKRAELFDDPDSAVAASCLTYMAICFTKDRRLVQKTTEPKGSLLYRQWPFLEYSARHWGSHAATSCIGPAETPLRDFVFSLDFFSVWVAHLLCSFKSVKNWKTSWMHTDEPEWIRIASLLTAETSPLHFAALYGMPGLFEECLSRGLDVNQCDANGATPFLLACAMNRQSIVRLLLGRGASMDANAVDKKGRGALFYASHADNTELFRFLVDCPAVDVNIGKALEISSQDGDGHLDMLEMLLTHADFNLYKQDHALGVEAVGGLARRNREGGKSLEMMKLLVGRPDFHVRKAPYEESSLSDTFNYLKNTDYALDFFEPEEVTDFPPMLLLLDKTFPDLSDFYAMRTLLPFVYLAYAGYFKLPGEGEDKSDKSSAGGSKLKSKPDRATEKAIRALHADGFIPLPVSGGPDVYGVNFFDSDFYETGSDFHKAGPQVIRTALRTRMQREGISFLSTDAHGRGFLHAVAGVEFYRDEVLPVLNFLLCIGLDPNARDHHGRVPLHYAAAKGPKDLIDLFLAAGADPLARDDDGWTALHWAAKGASVEVLELLVAKGVDVLATTRAGETVLHITAEKFRGNPRGAIEFLLARGCRLDARDKAGFVAGHVALWGLGESLRTCLERGHNAFALDEGFGNSVLMNAVYLTLAEETAICLSYLPASPAAELNRVGGFGMSVLDYLAQFDRTVTAKLGFTDQNWSLYTPTPVNVRRKYLLRFFLYRIQKMIDTHGDPKAQRDLVQRAVHQLSCLGDESAARIMYEQMLVPESRVMDVPFFRETNCSSCQIRDAPLFKCRTCPFVAFCRKCQEGVPLDTAYSDTAHCKGHGFFEIPGPDWRNLTEGVVNKEGQSLNEFLWTLQGRYSRELALLEGQGEQS